jgi:hypothetical protein
MFSLLRNDILNSFLFWAACGTKLTQRLWLSTFPLAELYFSWNCCVSVGDGRF